MHNAIESIMAVLYSGLMLAIMAWFAYALFAIKRAYTAYCTRQSRLYPANAKAHAMRSNKRRAALIKRMAL